MKTAEEFALENGAYKLEQNPNIFGYCEFDAGSFISLAEAIQLDAFKAGMTKAIDTIEYWINCHEGRLKMSPNNNYIMCEIEDCQSLKRHIERFRDNMKKI